MGVNYFSVVLVVVVVITGCCHGFKDIEDGAKIVDPKSTKVVATMMPDSYSIPMRAALTGGGGKDNKQEASASATGSSGTGGGISAAISGKFDQEEFSLISRMKTMEIPPNPSAQDFYASSKHVNGPAASRFFSRSKRSLKFEDGAGGSGGNSNNNNNHDNNNNLPPPPPRDFSKAEKDENGKILETESNKRLFPELFGLHSSPYYPQYPHYTSGYHHYPHHGHHGGGGGYYPGAGGLGAGGYYPGAGGAGFYPGGGFGGGGYYPPGGANSATASASAASGGGNGYNGYGNNLYGNGGYYPGGYGGGGGGYYPPGGIAPFIGGPPSGLGLLGGFFREDGKGGAVAGGTGEKVGATITVTGSDSPSGGGGRATGGVSFGE